MEKRLIMFGYAMLLASSMYGCGIYEGMSMKPHKTTVSTNTTMSNVDKANDDKDQEKESFGLTVKQEFVWQDK
tara:strand:- start:1221 stop:1439 length:219 start_codon:yes stop_codon:yes gene_type:complete